MDKIDLEELERLAKAATPGPWYPANNHTAYDGYGESVFSTEQTHNLDNNLDYIAAACGAVPSLIARVRELERQRDLLAVAVSECQECKTCMVKSSCLNGGHGGPQENCVLTFLEWAKEAAKEAGE